MGCKSYYNYKKELYFSIVGHCNAWLKKCAGERKPVDADPNLKNMSIKNQPLPAIFSVPDNHARHYLQVLTDS